MWSSYGALCGGMKMTDDTPKRMMVTLPPWVIERVRSFQAQRGYPSEAQAIRKLIETGLGAFDSKDDLLSQCMSATRQNANISDLLGGLLDGHPLVNSIDLNPDELSVHIRGGHKIIFNRRTGAWLRDWRLASEELEIPF